MPGCTRLFDALDQLVNRAHRHTFGHRIDHLRQTVMTALQQHEQFVGRREQASADKPS
jgi:hypothetical protein